MDELKTHLRGAQIVLRSKTPDLVRQEFYGLLMTHFAVRGLMHEAALLAEEDPDRLSFLHAVRVVRRKLPHFVAIPPSGEEGLPWRGAGGNPGGEGGVEPWSPNFARSQTQNQPLSYSCPRRPRHRPDRLHQAHKDT